MQIREFWQNRIETERGHPCPPTRRFARVAVVRKGVHQLIKDSVDYFEKKYGKN